MRVELRNPVRINIPDKKRVLRKPTRRIRNPARMPPRQKEDMEIVKISEVCERTQPNVLSKGVMKTDQA